MVKNMELNNDYNVIPYVFTVISMIFYAILTFPQIYTIIKIKTSDCISILTIFTFSTADTLNLLGVIFLDLEQTLKIIGWYHLMMSYILLIVVVFYNKTNVILLKIFYVFLIFLEFTTAIVVHILMTNAKFKNTNTETLGTVLAWISVCMYLVGRFPQIYLNYKNKKTYGLSIYMFVFSILGNLFYTLSILAYSIEYTYIIRNLAWIVLCITGTVVDLVIISQCVIYTILN